MALQRKFKITVTDTKALENTFEVVQEELLRNQKRFHSQVAQALITEVDISIMNQNTGEITHFCGLVDVTDFFTTRKYNPEELGLQFADKTITDCVCLAFDFAQALPDIMWYSLTIFFGVKDGKLTDQVILRREPTKEIPNSKWKIVKFHIEFNTYGELFI